MTPSPNPSSIPEITSDQLKRGDPSLLNRTLKMIYGQIAQLQGRNGAVNIPANLTVSALTLTGQSVRNPPDGNQALTLSVANSLYSPQALRQALISRSFQGQPIAGLPSSESTAAVLEDTHAHRVANYQAASYQVGQLFYETDRDVLYINESIGTPAKQQWTYIDLTQTGTAVNPADTRPTDLGANDQGYLFYATDVELTMEWQWSSLSSKGIWAPAIQTYPTLQGTHTARLATTAAPALFAPGTIFYETDRKVFYIVEVSTSTNQWFALPILAMVGTVSGTDQRPTDLGPNDYGFLFRSTDRGVIYYWSGIAWAIYYQVAPALIGTHATRTSTPYASSNYAIGQQWIETDRGNICYVAVNSGAFLWQYQSGTMVGVDSAKPTGLGSADTGFEYFSTDTGALNVWTGAAWQSSGGSVSGGGLTFSPAITLNTSAAGTGSVALPSAGSYMVVFSATFNVIGAGDANVVLTASLSAGGSAVFAGPAGAVSTVGNSVYLFASSGVTLSVNVSKASGSGTSTCTAASITYIRVGS